MFAVRILREVSLDIVPEDFIVIFSRSFFETFFKNRFQSLTKNRPRAFLTFPSEEQFNSPSRVVPAVRQIARVEIKKSRGLL